MRVVRASGGEAIEADGAWIARSGVVCTVGMADCLPVLFCDRAGTRVAAAHAGWRGLAAGVLEATVAALAVAPDQPLAWLRPAIGAAAFEVGPEVRAAFLAADAEAVTAFQPGRAGRWQADLVTLSRPRLRRAGVAQVWGGHWCTSSEPAWFFSHRRDGTSGRMAALIWRA